MLQTPPPSITTLERILGRDTYLGTRWWCFRSRLFRYEWLGEENDWDHNLLSSHLNPHRKWYPPVYPHPLPNLPIQNLHISTIASNKITAIDSLSHHQTFTVGDYRPGNILAKFGSTGGDLERIYVLDWELSKLGLVGLDLGQFTARMHLLHRFNPSSSASTLLTSFLKSYHLSASPSEELARSCDNA